MSNCQHACATGTCEHCELLDKVARAMIMLGAMRDASTMLLDMFEKAKQERDVAVAAIERVRAVCATIERDHRQPTSSGDRRAVLQQGERLAVSAILDALKG